MPSNNDEMTPSEYAHQVLYPAIETEVRNQFKGRLTSEIDGEIKVRQNAEHTAMAQLTPQEIEVSRKFRLKPSQYLESKSK